jgi:hypothetical protein
MPSICLALARVSTDFAWSPALCSASPSALVRLAEFRGLHGLIDLLHVHGALVRERRRRDQDADHRRQGKNLLQHAFLPVWYMPNL